MMRSVSAAKLLCAAVALCSCAAGAETGDEAVATETRCAEQGGAMANAAVMRDAGAPRFEALATARRDLEHSQVDQGAFISQLEEHIKTLYLADSPFRGSPLEIGRIWQKNCICEAGPAWAKRCGELQAPLP